MTIDSSASSDLDRTFMARALEVAERARFNASPNPAVGCVLVRDGHIVAQGWTQPPGGPHAEIVALNNCDNARGTTAYTTLEPCVHYGRTGPCCDALIEAGVSRVVAALQDPFEEVRGQGFARLRAAGIEVVVGVLEEQARILHAGFISRLERGRPWVTVKIAASLDGATALANGQSKWITCAKARQDVHLLRARSDVIVTGAGTVIADDPMLTARVSNDWPLSQPRAVVLDSQFRSPASATVFQRNSLVYTLSGAQVPANAVFEHAVLPASDVGGLSLSALLDDLGARSVNDVMVEAGAKLSGAFIRSGLADRLVLYQAPKLMGSGARGMVDLGELTHMNQVLDLKLLDSHLVGECTKMVFGFGSDVSQPNE